MTSNERPVRLGLNIDHVATLRNARGAARPDPIRAAKLAIEAGADSITAHLREDRRHIRDEDIRRLMAEVEAPLNLEMAATEEMTAIAVRARPHACCIVPEHREEVTTEGGLDVAGGHNALAPMVRRLLDAGQHRPGRPGHNDPANIAVPCRQLYPIRRNRVGRPVHVNRQGRVMAA